MIETTIWIYLTRPFSCLSYRQEEISEMIRETNPRSVLMREAKRARRVETRDLLVVSTMKTIQSIPSQALVNSNCLVP